MGGVFVASSLQAGAWLVKGWEPEDWTYFVFLTILASSAPLLVVAGIVVSVWGCS